MSQERIDKVCGFAKTLSLHQAKVQRKKKKETLKEGRRDRRSEKGQNCKDHGKASLGAAGVAVTLKTFRGRVKENILGRENGTGKCVS